MEQEHWWRSSSRSAHARSSTRGATPRSRSRWPSTTARWPGPRCRPARPRVSTRRSSCATATPRATAARASRRPSRAVLDEIGPELVGMEAVDQRIVDQRLVDLDGTPDKSRLGANALLGVSLAVAKAAAESSGLELFRYLGGPERARAARADDEHHQRRRARRHVRRRAGVHDRADRRRVLPRGAALGRGGLPLAQVGAEGQGPGHRPRRRGRLRPRPARHPRRARPDRSRPSRRPATPLGRDIVLALDVAATEFHSDGRLLLRGPASSPPRRCRRSTPSSSTPTRWSPSRTRWPRTTGTAGSQLTSAIGDKVQIVGDDLFVTNPERLDEGIARGAANALLVKVNQIGTLSETLDAVSLAHIVRLPLHDEPPLAARPRTPRSPTSPSPPAAGRSRPAPRPGPSASPSTTSCCASRRYWATPRATRATSRSRASRRRRAEPLAEERGARRPRRRGAPVRPAGTGQRRPPAGGARREPQLRPARAPAASSPPPPGCSASPRRAAPRSSRSSCARSP